MVGVKIGELSLFWKRKKVDRVNPNIKTPFKESRMSFRVQPTEVMPVNLFYRGIKLDIYDISAGGFSTNSLSLKVQTNILLQLEIPGYLSQTDVLATVVCHSKGGKDHIGFQKLAVDVSDALHLYVLDVQKEDLRDKHLNQTSQNYEEMTDKCDEGVEKKSPEKME